MFRSAFRVTICFLLLASVHLGTKVLAQPLVGTNAISDSIWVIDTTSWNVTQRIKATLSGDVITGINGLAYDPVLHDTYCLLTTAGFPNSTLLATLNLANGVCTQVGNLNDVFSSITFRADGQLLGVVGDNGSNPETLYLIDKTNAAKTLGTALGNGDQGEAICYNHQNTLLYHWSGNTTKVFEKLPASSPFTPFSNITTTGLVGGQILCAVYLGGNRFLVSTTNGKAQRLQTDGSYSTILGNTPRDLHGLAMPPRFSLSGTFVCIYDTVDFNLQGLALDTAIYDWGDGTITKEFPAAPSSHVYQNTGTYPVTASLANSISGPEILFAANIQVNPLPNVIIFPHGDTTICTADSLLLGATFGGTSRWYRNGVIIPGANTNQYIARMNGWYNMTKTNSNGCTDSAAVGMSIVFGYNAPTPSITYDTTSCPTIAFQSNDPYGATWLWDFGDGGTSTAANPIHTYSATGSYTAQVIASNGCHTDSATATVIVDCFIGLPKEWENAISVFPNPSDGAFVLQVHLPSEVRISYQITDLSGRRLHFREVGGFARDLTERVDLDLTPGIYVLAVDAGDLRRCLRICIR